MRNALVFHGRAKDLLAWLKSAPLTLTVEQYIRMREHGPMRA